MCNTRLKISRDKAWLENITCIQSVVECYPHLERCMDNNLCGYFAVSIGISDKIYVYWMRFYIVVSWIKCFINDRVIIWERRNRNVNWKLKMQMLIRTQLHEIAYLELVAYSIYLYEAGSCIQTWCYALFSWMRANKRMIREENCNMKYLCICIECGKMRVRNFSIAFRCMCLCADDFSIHSNEYTKLIKLRYQKSKLMLCSTVTRLQEKFYNI